MCKTGYFVARSFRETFGILDPLEAPSKEHSGCKSRPCRNVHYTVANNLLACWNDVRNYVQGSELLAML